MIDRKTRMVSLNDDSATTLIFLEPQDNDDDTIPTEEGTDDDYLKPRRKKPRKSRTATRTRSSTRRHVEDDEEEYHVEEEEPSADEDEDDSLSESAQENDFIASDSEDGSRPKRVTRTRRLQTRAQRHRRASEEYSEDFPTLEDELAELKENDSPPRRKHLRARKEINYQILPPPAMDEPIDFAPSAPTRKKAAPQRSLFKTSGPFGAGLLPIFGQNNNPGALKAAGGVHDSDSSDDDFRPKPGNAIGAAPVRGKKAQLADSDPLGIDTDIDFSVVGGLDNYIDQLKEMVSLPLKYPEVYQRFGVTPPRGVLFHGPPGTGKTLMARALAASCSSEGKKVTFYMRKGADILSKWVGEAERQLRLLFEEAKNNQPSIIFFDEIDGLAPVRSSKQEQIHASIVSTLLALMDGMDNRGQVIVIGATNRPDSVDSALRRPGRFDREFYFPLPDHNARKQIIGIHTRKWEKPLDENFVEHIARATKGYGGADLRALCTEAALAAIQRRYPQIYQSKDKLLIDPTTIHVAPRDFMKSIDKIIPSSARSTSSNAVPLPLHIEPLLSDVLAELKKKLDNFIPRKKKITPLEEAMLEDFHDDDGGFARLESTREFQTSRVFRPRLLVCGASGMGQQYLGSAMLHHLEGFHIQAFDLGTLLSDSSRTPEAAMVQLLVEVRRHTPSVLFIPNVDTWWATMSDTARRTFASWLRGLKTSENILVLALMEQENVTNPEINSMFGFSGENIHSIPPTTDDAREKFFELLVNYIKSKPTDFPDLENRPKRQLEVLPVAPPETDKPLTDAEHKAAKRRDMQLKNKLKIKLSAIMEPLKTRYKKFKKPIIELVYLLHLLDPLPLPMPGMAMQQAYTKTDDDMILEVSSGRKYYNMDLEVIEERLWNGYYSEPKEFMRDVKKIHKDSLTSGDRERIMRSSEMLTNTEVYIDEVNADAQFVADCAELKKREQEKYLKELAQKKEEEKLAQDLDSSTTLVTGPEISPFFKDKDVKANGHTITDSDTLVDTVMEDAHGVESQKLNAQAGHGSEPDTTAPPVATEPTISDALTVVHTNESFPQPEPELILDTEYLAFFSRSLVRKTKGLTIERIEQLNSALIDLLWIQRQDWNRNTVISALEQKLDAVLESIEKSKMMEEELARNCDFYA